MTNLVLTVKLTGSNTYAAGTAITFTVTKFSTPTNGQNAVTNIAAATSNDLSATPVVLLDTTDAGTFPQIGEGSSVTATTSPSKSHSSSLSMSLGALLIFVLSALLN
jgi:hypothetical protein